jgi:tetratricopeptide (TPR) repeat protein
MEYQVFTNQLQNGRQLQDSGRLKEAEAAFYQLFLSDISDLDKVDICIHLAEISDKLGSLEQVLEWYDRGISIEGLYSRYSTAEKKAEYLSQRGRSAEAVPIYEALLKQPYISEAEKERMRKVTQLLLSRTLRGWK